MNDQLLCGSLLAAAGIAAAVAGAPWLAVAAIAAAIPFLAVGVSTAIGGPKRERRVAESR
jgi:hypothetical protein